MLALATYNPTPIKETTAPADKQEVAGPGYGIQAETEVQARS